MLAAQRSDGAHTGPAQTALEVREEPRPRPLSRPLPPDPAPRVLGAAPRVLGAELRPVLAASPTLSNSGASGSAS